MSETFVRPDAPLCVILVDYTADLPAIDEALPRHAAWLKQGFDSGLIVACGRRTPRTGGVIVMRGDLAGGEAVAATDPFVTEGLATTTVIPFVASMATAALADYLA